MSTEIATSISTSISLSTSTSQSKKQSAHHALQRLVVRMQYDAALADKLLHTPSALDAEIARLGLGPREAAWLRATDPRAFHHDPLKRRRALHGLLGEMKASSAIALAETRRVAFLDGFFCSAPFHAAVQHDGSLAAAFADFLLAAGLETPQLPGVVAVEAALARSRRDLEAAGGVDWKAPPIPTGGLTHVALAPGVGASRHAPDALEAIAAVERYLFEVGLVPALVLAEDAPRLELPPPTDRPPTPLGFVPTQSGISLVELEPDLYHALSRVAEAAPACPIARIGRALAASLVEDEVLVAVPAPLR